MPKRERRGDFLVTTDELDRAETAFNERSPRSRALDKAFRAPITDDVDRWIENQRGLDFPGVDTPTAAPRQAAMDFPAPDERDRLARGQLRDVDLVEDAGREPVGDMFEIPEPQFESLEKGLRMK